MGHKSPQVSRDFLNKSTAKVYMYVCLFVHIMVIFKFFIIFFVCNLHFIVFTEDKGSPLKLYKSFKLYLYQNLIVFFLNWLCVCTYTVAIQMELVSPMTH